MAEPIHFPNGKLPEMTQAERKLWAASHNLPADMLLVSVREMTEMKMSFDACVREVKDWRRIGRMYMAADLPEGCEPALRAYMAAKEELDRKVKELVQQLTALRSPPTRAETLVKGSTRTIEP